MINAQQEFKFPYFTTTITREMLDPIRNNETIKHITIPRRIKKIERCAFAECTHIESISIPHSISEIEEHTFYGCKSLTSIDIPDSVTHIENHAFASCISLTSIEIPGSVTYIAECLFECCKGLTSITIPSSVTEIKEGAFRCCVGLTAINIPDSVTHIKHNAFAYCTGLTYINIPESVTCIAESVLAGCEGLTSINIPNDTTEIRTSTFASCKGLTSIDIPINVNKIGCAAFDSCEGLKLIDIPNSVSVIGDAAFASCKGLRSIKIPSSVTEIKKQVFFGCEGLKYLFITNSLKNKGAEYWSEKGINIEKATLITHDEFSEWANNQKLSSSYYERAYLYQLQKDDSFTPSWPELHKFTSNLLMGDFLMVLPKEKRDIVFPRRSTIQSYTACLANHSLFSVAPARSRQAHEQKVDQLEKDGFKEYNSPDDLTKTIQLREVSPAATSAILQWLTLREVATLLIAKATSDLKPMMKDEKVVESESTQKVSI